MKNYKKIKKKTNKIFKKNIGYQKKKNNICNRIVRPDRYQAKYQPKPWENIETVPT